MVWEFVKNNLDVFGFSMSIVESYFPAQSNRIEDAIDRFRERCFKVSAHGTSTWFGNVFAVAVIPLLFLTSSILLDLKDIPSWLWPVFWVLASPALVMMFIAILASLLDVLDRIHPTNRSLNSLLNLIGLIGLVLDNIS